MEYNLSFIKHPKINADLLPFLRLYIAQKESKHYCIKFNTNILQLKGIDKVLLEDIDSNIEEFPFDIEQKLLFSKVIYAIYNADSFRSDDLQELYDVGFSDKDFFELVNYATDFMAKSKMIEIYLDNNRGT